jgi:hypothetical protein
MTPAWSGRAVRHAIGKAEARTALRGFVTSLIIQNGNARQKAGDFVCGLLSPARHTTPSSTSRITRPSGTPSSHRMIGIVRSRSGFRSLA